MSEIYSESVRIALSSNGGRVVKVMGLHLLECEEAWVQAPVEPPRPNDFFMNLCIINHFSLESDIETYISWRWHSKEDTPEFLL